MKKIIYCILTFFILLLLPNISYAERENFDDQVIAYLQDLNRTNIQITSKIELKDSGRNHAYEYYELQVGKKPGYAVLDLNTKQIIEFSFDNPALRDLKSLINKNVFYLGVTEFYLEEKDGLINLRNGQLVSNKTEINNLLLGEVVCAKNESSSKPFSIVDSNKFKNLRSSNYITLSHTLPNYKYNPSGICGSTAAAMMLRYMDLYFNSNFVPTNLQSSDGVALIKNLETYIHHGTTGSTAPQLAIGISKYLSRKVNYSATYDPVEGHILYGQIADGKPYIIGVYNHPDYGWHWMTGYGYSNGWAIVNDGWGSTGVHVNPNYMNYVVRLQ